MELSSLEKSVLQNMHLRGVPGKMGSMSYKDRLNLMGGLVDKGLLTPAGKVTAKGVEASRDYKTEGSELLASAPSEEKIISLISQFYYGSTISLRGQEVSNKNGPINGVRVVFRNGRFRFERGIPERGESKMEGMARLSELSASEQEMAPVDKDVLLDGGAFLVKRYHIITTRHVIYAAYESVRGIAPSVGKKTGIEYSTTFSGHGTPGNWGQIGSGIPKGEWETMSGEGRSTVVHNEYEKQYKRAHAMIIRAFPEASRLAHADGSELSFTLSGNPQAVLPDLRGS